MELRASADCGRVSADGSEMHYVTLTFTAPPAETTKQRDPVNLGIAIDRSGSMSGHKYELACKGVETSLRMLHETDRFALVAFDHEVTAVTGSVNATLEARWKAVQDLRRMSARGNTNLSGGWLTVADEAVSRAARGEVTRVIVLTDGQANAGLLDEQQFEAAAKQLRTRGIVTSTLGIGRDFNERLLERMAIAGGGNSYYIENAEQLPDVLAGETGETLEVVLREACVEVHAPQGARVILLERYESQRVAGGQRVLLGDLTSRQLVQLSFEVVLPAADPGASVAMEFALHAIGMPAALGTARLVWECVTPEEAAAAPRDPATLAAVAPLIEARARHEAIEYNRQGQFAQSRRVLRDTAQRLREVAPSLENALMRAMSLESDEAAHGQVMDASDMKRRHIAAHQVQRGRDEMGKARKGREGDQG